MFFEILLGYGSGKISWYQPYAAPSRLVIKMNARRNGNVQLMYRVRSENN